ncbi:MAG: alpha/beta hydrolase fold domain-containing protein [Methylobacteriaceae bacterium]|nr:alpha/beta hydrolase fold domain-containing protein [Methylobacteriaceae bacterium]
MQMKGLAFLAAAISCLFGSAFAQDAQTIEHQGIARQVLVRAPSPAPAGKLPLLLYLHGVRPVDWKNHSDRALDALADREGVVTAYPEAVGFRWNFAQPMRNAQRVGDQVVDDFGFIEKLIDKLIAENNVDPSRIYVIGDSRGGLMTFSVICRFADKIAAAAPLITGMFGAQVAACHPSRAVPLMAVAGTDDTWQNYDGFLNKDSRLLSVPETMEFWRRQHRCTGMDWKILPHRMAEDGTRIMLTTWTGCAAEGAVRLYRVNGGGHQVPTFAAGNPEWIEKGGR